MGTEREDLGRLDALERQACALLREAAGGFSRPALLFSGGKDSATLLSLARKAFGGAPGAIPFALLSVETGRDFPEALAFRDRVASELGLELVVARVQDCIERGSARLAREDAPRNALQSVALMEAVAERGFDCLLGGARRDEERARAKERLFSHRDEHGQWRPARQRPEMWSLFNLRARQAEHFRCFPLSNWTEVDVWRHVEREGLELPELYYARERELVARQGRWLSPRAFGGRPGEEVRKVWARHRTVGDVDCTCAVESRAATPAEVIEEILAAERTERGSSRLDDLAADCSMERRKMEGYF